MMVLLDNVADSPVGLVVFGVNEVTLLIDVPELLGLGLLRSLDSCHFSDIIV